LLKNALGLLFKKFPPERPAWSRIPRRLNQIKREAKIMEHEKPHSPGKRMFRLMAFHLIRVFEQLIRAFDRPSLTSLLLGHLLKCRCFIPRFAHEASDFSMGHTKLQTTEGIETRIKIPSQYQRNTGIGKVNNKFKKYTDILYFL